MRDDFEQDVLDRKRQLEVDRVEHPGGLGRQGRRSIGVCKDGDDHRFIFQSEDRL